MEIPAGRASRRSIFTASPRLEDGEFHVGKIKLSGTPDPFESDDKRFFVFRVRPPLKVLFLSDDPYEAEFVAAALDPESAGSARSFLVETVTHDRFAALEERSSKLTRAFSCSTSGSSKSPNGERSISTFMRAGGWWSRPVIAAGRKVTTMRSPANSCRRSSKIGPGRLPPRPRSARSPTSRILCFSGTARTLTACSRMVPVYHYWPIKQPAEGTHTLLSFSDGAPALVERTFKGPKTGRVLLWTTPLSRRPEVGARPAGEPECLERTPVASWPFLVMMIQTVPYLAGVQRRAQFRGGPECALKLEPTARFTKFL